MPSILNSPQRPCVQNEQPVLPEGLQVKIQGSHLAGKALQAQPISPHQIHNTEMSLLKNSYIVFLSKQKNMNWLSL